VTPSAPAAAALEGPAAGVLGGERLLRLLAVAGQFVLLGLVVRQYQLESRTFLQVLMLAGICFPIHALLPAAYRWPFFALVSLGSVGVAFGYGAGSLLLGLGAGLIGLCHLPVPIGVRIGLVLGAGALLAAMRTGWGPMHIPAAVWPILGAMFMFRLALYLHYLRHQETTFSLSRALSYFFLLPNACFPLFPVVDYKRFVRSHFDGAPAEIYQAGLQMMFRGLVHLLLYRFVYYHLTLDARDLRDLGDLLQYLLSTFFLYLRVSGQFHLIVGLLHLFGYRLPETHHLYFLATGFTDFWRRINIYWKDFMMKLVYYPSFFRLRRLGNTPAIVLSTLAVFVVTWALHSYQWFWLRGTFPVTWSDTLFWGILAGLVVIATLRESGAARQRRRPSRGWELGLGIRTVATFVTICVLWSLWSSESVGEWLSMWRVGLTADGGDLLLLGGLLVAGLGIGGRAWGARELTDLKPVEHPAREYFRAAGVLAASTVGLLLLGSHRVQALLPERLAQRIVSIQESRLSTRDAALQQRGYYENLDNVNRFNTQLWEIEARRDQPAVNMRSTAAHHNRPDFLMWDMRGRTSVVFAGETLTTNQWGMRDREYTRPKPPGTFRIALLGPSDVMGWGVGDGETFEAMVEADLNAAAAPGAPVEILNFGVYSYSLLHQLALLEDRVWSFQPDLIILTAHYSTEAAFIRTHLARAALAGIEVPYDYPRQVVQQAGISRETPEPEAIRNLAPFADSVVQWAIGRLGAEIAAHRVPGVLLAIQLPAHGTDTTGRIPRAAEAAGFRTIDLSAVLPALPEEYFLAEADRHPNAAGHRVLADHLLRGLAQLEPRFRSARPSATSTGAGVLP